MASNTNIGYWESVLQAPTPAYQKLFEAERTYLLAHIESDQKVLDVGCGDGRNMKTILEKTGFVTGVDHDEIAVQDAVKLFSNHPNVKLVRGDASSLPFKDETFDVVTFLMILPNLDAQKQKALTEAARVLKKDGIFILSTFAETAFDDRMEIYKQIELPIERIEGTKVFFPKSVGANTSEQFSLIEIEELASTAGLRLLESEKVGDLAYICRLHK
jgi:ubiquinone/menaquinone biosynthesis C-methylase UbiE